MPTLAPPGASARGSPLSVSWIRISRIAAMLLPQPRDPAAVCELSDRDAQSAPARRLGSRGCMDGGTLAAQRLSRVEEAFASLPQRYLGAEPGFDATVPGPPRRRRPHLGGAGSGRPLRGPPLAAPRARRRDRDRRRRPGSRFARAGCRGSTRSRSRSLYARGDLDLAVGFEGLFRLPDERPPLLRDPRRRRQRARHLDLSAGSGAEHVILPPRPRRRQELVLRHRLRADARLHGSTRSTCPASARRRSRSRAPYDAALLRAHRAARSWTRSAIETAPPGRQLDGRARRARARARRARARLAASRCWRPRSPSCGGRELVPLVRLLRPELAAIPHPLRARAGPAPLLAHVRAPRAARPRDRRRRRDEFLRTYRSRSARIAFYAAARNIYLDAARTAATASGPGSESLRAAGAVRLGRRATGSSPPRFSRHVGEALPGVTAGRARRSAATCPRSSCRSARTA